MYMCLWQGGLLNILKIVNDCSYRNMSKILTLFLNNSSYSVFCEDKYSKVEQIYFTTMNI